MTSFGIGKVRDLFWSYKGVFSFIFYFSGLKISYFMYIFSIFLLFTRHLKALCFLCFGPCMILSFSNPIIDISASFLLTFAYMFFKQTWTTLFIFFLKMCFLKVLWRSIILYKTTSLFFKIVKSFSYSPFGVKMSQQLLLWLFPIFYKIILFFLQIIYKFGI